MNRLLTALETFDYETIKPLRRVNYLVKPGTYGSITVTDPQGTPLPHLLIQHGMANQLVWLLANKQLTAHHSRWPPHYNNTLLVVALADLRAQQIVGASVLELSARFTIAKSLIEQGLGVTHPSVLERICSIEPITGWGAIDDVLLAPALQHISVDATLPFAIIQRIVDSGHPFTTERDILTNLVQNRAVELIDQRPRFITALVRREPTCLADETGANPYILTALIDQRDPMVASVQANLLRLFARTRCTTILDVFQLSLRLAHTCGIQPMSRCQIAAILIAQESQFASILHALLNLVVPECCPANAPHVAVASAPFPLDMTTQCTDYIGLDDVCLADAVVPNSPWFVFCVRPHAICCINEEHFRTLLFDETNWHDGNVKLWYFDISAAQLFAAYMCGSRCYYITQRPDGTYCVEHCAI